MEEIQTSTPGAVCGTLPGTQFRVALQVEVLFKAKSSRRTRGLVSPAGQNISIQWAEKGSYRHEHLLAFLRRWLDPFTPERREAGDWRILMMDCATSHLEASVADICMERGYVVLYHYGCTTGIAQVNDTDLHGRLSQVYISLEEMRFCAQQLVDPGNISRTLQDVLDDAAAAWRQVDHEGARLGHWRVGLANKLDGSEDALITREALLFWNACQMREARRQAIDEVDAAVDSGDLQSFVDWPKLIQHPQDCGVVEDDGAEFEGELEPGEAAFEEEDKRALEDAEERSLWEAEEASLDNPPPLHIVPSDDPADVEEASVAAKRLEQLKRLRALAISARVPAAAHSVARELDQLQRGFAAGGRADKRKINEVLRREMDRQFAEESARVKASQEAALEVRRAAVAEKAAAAKAKAAALAAAEEKAALQKRLEDLPKVISAAEAAVPGSKGQRTRSDALERLKLRSPKLAFEEEARWAKLRDEYARIQPKLYATPGIAGHEFVKLLNNTLQALGVHYEGVSQWNKDGAQDGDPAAFATLFRRLERAVPKPCASVSF